MPPNNSADLSQQPKNRKRTTSERVLPAIPLGLSKPTVSKPKPKAEADVRAGAGAEKVVPNSEEPLSASAHQGQVGLTNGEVSSPSSTDAIAPTTQAMDSAVRMPTSNAPRSRDSRALSLSFGGTPELPTTDATNPSTPPTALQQSPSSTSPASSRKPTERFDMRSIRTELPPAFVPSAEYGTPRSAASSRSNRPANINPYAQQVLPSAGSIAFGNQGESATSSPAPPQSAGGSAFVSPSFSNFGATQQRYFTPQGHAHHSSEPFPQRAYHTGYSQQGPPWNGHSGYQYPPQGPAYHPHAHTPFRYPQRDVFTPPETYQTNGQASRSRSASQASSDRQKASQVLQSPVNAEHAIDQTRATISDPKTSYSGHANPRQSQFNPQMAPSPFMYPDASSSFENAETLRSHVFSQFANPSLADCQFEITDDHESDPRTFDGHKIILTRSKVLWTLIQSNESTTSPPKIQIRLEGKYTRASTFVDILRYLYGGPLLALDHHRPGSSSGEHIPSNVERMEAALQYIATGTFLRVAAVAGRGVDVANGLLHWDTITTAIAFALDGGFSHIWSVDDGSEDKASNSSSDDSLGRLETTGTPSYDPYSTILLQRIVEFTVHAFPPNFYLDASAPQLASSPRLPALPQGHEARPSRSDPRLSQIRFGEQPAEDHQRPSFAATIISSMLLSLPFTILKCTLEHPDLASRLGPDTVASIMRQVVTERERRRTKVLNARSAGQINEADSQLQQNLFWHEFVEPSAQHRAGFRLARRRRDIDTPPSSGACSERNK